MFFFIPILVSSFHFSHLIKFFISVFCNVLYLTYVTVGGKIFARSLPLLRAKLAPYLKVPGVSVRTARTGAMQDIKNNSLPGLAAITSNGSGV